MGGSSLVQSFPVVADGNSLRVVVPGTFIHGSPRRWGYQVLVKGIGSSAASTISDLIDPMEISQKDLFAALSSGQRSDIPFVRIRTK